MELDVDVVNLIVRSLQDRAPEEAAQALLEWRRLSSANERHYQDIAEIWAATSLGEAEIATTRSQAWDIIGRAKDRPVRPSRERSETRRWNHGWRIAAATATVGLGIGLALVGSFTTRSASSPVLSWGVTEYHTAEGERVTVRLEDGTIVRLAPTSRLRTTGSRTAREITLEGQAFFAVAKNPDFPFVVRTNAGDAQVLGTRFDVRVSNGDMRVVVVDGTVDVRVREHVLKISEGEMAISHAEGVPALVAVADVYSMLDWMGEVLVFQETRLDKAIGEIERLYGTTIVLTDDDLAARTITASFTGQPFEDVMAITCRAVQVRCLIDNGSATITPTATF
jgi:transmembrane sensor